MRTPRSRNKNFLSAEEVSSVVEEKLLQLLGDPDERLVLRQNVRKRLVRQKGAVAKGERGESLETVVRRHKMLDSISQERRSHGVEF